MLTMSFLTLSKGAQTIFHEIGRYLSDNALNLTPGNQPGKNLRIYYTKELGVREARDKDAPPLAAELPKRLLYYVVYFCSDRYSVTGTVLSLHYMHSMIRFLL